MPYSPGLRKACDTLSLLEFPDSIEPVPEHHTITLGDMHGNALKLLFLLCFHGCFEPDQYERNTLKVLYYQFADLYDTAPDKFDQDYVDTAFALVDKLVFRTDCSVRFLGDLLADRGNNDFLTLLLLKRMHVCAMPYTIMLSNHDLEFFYAIETNFDHAPRITRMSSVEQYQSAKPLVSLIEKKLLTGFHLKNWLKTSVYPYIKMLDIEEFETAKVMYSHAPVCPNDIRLLYGYLVIKNLIVNTLDSPTLFEIANALNHAVANILSSNNITLHFESRESHNLLSNFLWRRFPSSKKIPINTLLTDGSANNANLHFVCGHDEKPEHLMTLSRWHSLDQSFGKSPDCSDTYAYYYFASPVMQRSRSNTAIVNMLYNKMKSHSTTAQELIKLVGQSISYYALGEQDNLANQIGLIQAQLGNTNKQTAGQSLAEDILNIMALSSSSAAIAGGHLVNMHEHGNPSVVTSEHRLSNFSVFNPTLISDIEAPPAMQVHF